MHITVQITQPGFKIVLIQQFLPPSNLQITLNSIISVTLNWQDNSTGEEGFKIERKYEGENWEQLTTTTNSAYVDSDFDLNTQVYYRICAYSGNYNSSWIENSFDATIPPPENLVIVINSGTSLTLNWDYSNTGHEGFKIDRLINQGTWEEEFAVVNAGQNSFIDNGLNLGSNFYTYRVYSYYQTYYSQKEEIMSPIVIGMNLFGGIVFYLDGTGGGMVCRK